MFLIYEIFILQELVNFLLSLEFFDVNQNKEKKKSYLTFALENKKYKIAFKLCELTSKINENDLNMAFKVINKELFR